MVIEVRLVEPTQATGRIVDVGDGGVRGYQLSAEILRLEADEYGGDWYKGMSRAP
jgi:hypothetical protein